MWIVYILLGIIIGAGSFYLRIRFRKYKPSFKGKSIYKGEWWEGYYVYSSYEDKHYIVQDAKISGSIGQFVRFCHFTEIDPNSLTQITK